MEPTGAAATGDQGIVLIPCRDSLFMELSNRTRALTSAVLIPCRDSLFMEPSCVL